MALLLVIIFICTAFVGRVLLQYKLTGDHGLRTSLLGASLKINNQPNWAAKMATLLFVTGFLGIFSYSVADAWLLGSTVGIDQSLSWRQILGIAISVIGLGLVSWSQLQMGQNWRIGVDTNEKTDLVTHGIFAFSRNPIYLAILIFCIGICLLLPELPIFCSVIAIFFAIELQIKQVEEPYLHALHGQDFLGYKATTGRYFTQ
jgi:protein-S-isoprenylcysteine O-methyltransferase Ste14